MAQTIKGDPSVAGVIIMMLSSLDLRADSIRCRDLAIPFLAKPVTPSDLRQAIENALGASPPDLARLARATTPHPSSGLRVLLAEDNAINQKLATRLLEKRGYSVIVACDGRRAIEEFHKQRFDLALMDLQMPLMGGFETTASIREIERETSGRLPIIALTAHAMNERRSPALYRGGYGWLCFKANSGGRAIWQNRRIAEG